MAARATQYAESLGSTQTTSATYSAKASVTFTPDASSNYLLLFSALIQNATNLTADAKVRLQNTTDTVTYHEQNLEMKDLTDWAAVHGAAIYTSSASPGSHTFAIEYAAETATNAINCKEARLTIIKLTASDAFVYTAGNSDGTTTAFTDVQTLTFTPATSGDYLVIASADVSNINNGDPFAVRLLDRDGTTAVGTMNNRVTKDATNFMAWGTQIKKTSLAASSQTFKIQVSNIPELGDTIRTRNRCIVALRLDTLDANYYAETRGRSTSTSTTYQSGASLTQTPAAVAHAIFACGIIDGSSTSISNYMQLLKGATQKTEMTQENQEGSPADCYSWMHFEVETLAASSTTWTVQAKSETTSTTTGRSEMAVAVLQLASSGLSATIGVVTAVASAQALTHRKTKAVGVVTVVASARPLTHRKTRAIAVVTVVASAQPLTHRKTKVIGVVTVVASARPIAWAPKRRLLGVVTTVASARPLTRRKDRIVGVATSVVNVRPLSFRKTKVVGVATAVASARPLNRTKAKTLGVSTSAASARPLAHPRARTLGVVTVVATARPLDRQKSKILGVVTVVASAQPVSYTGPKIQLIGVATSVAVARVLTSSMSGGGTGYVPHPWWRKKRRHRMGMDH